MAGKTRKTVELTDDETMAVREVITRALSEDCKIVCDHLDEHHGGSPVGLADARNWLGRVAVLGNVLDKLDPVGWREVIPREERHAAGEAGA
jgi:hypothetical protein